MPDEQQLSLPLSYATLGGKTERFFSFGPQHCGMHILHGVLGEVLLHYIDSYSVVGDILRPL